MRRRGRHGLKPIQDAKGKECDDKSDKQALNAVVSGFMSAESDGHEKEKLHSHFSPLRKRLVLGTIMDKPGGADSRES